MPREWTRLELLPPERDEPDVLVNGEPREVDEAEQRAAHRDDKWRQRGYQR